MDLVDIKIRREYRDMLKEYCKYSGDKMYILVEKLIEKKCRGPEPRKVLKSERR